ncbi:MAG: RNA-binding domain-containing protein [Zestosphaera sp.]
MHRNLTLTNLTLTAFSHSTEDPAKVKQAVLNLLPPELRSGVIIEEQVAKGHYGNPIILITFRLKERESEVLAFKHVVCSLAVVDRSLLMATLPRRVGAKNSVIHLRLSKQEALLGRAILMDGDDVVRLSATVIGVRRVEDLIKYMEGVMRECEQGTLT